MSGLERALDTLLLGAAAWPLLRVCVTPAFVRKLGAFPAVGALVALLLIGYVALVVVLAIWFPHALRLAVVALVGIVVVAGWRARRNCGRRRRWPPGSLALAPLGPWVDRFFYLKQAARHGPVFKMSHFVHPMVCVVGLARSFELIHQSDGALRTPPLPFSRFIPGGFLRYMKPEDHAVHRALLRSAITPALVRESRPFIVETVRHELARVADASRLAHPAGVHPGEYVSEIAFRTMARALFDIRPGTEAFARAQTLYGVLDFRRAWRLPPWRVHRILAELLAIVRAGQPAGHCVLSELMGKHLATIHDETLLRNVIYLLQTSAADLAGLMQWILWMLTARPEWMTRYREETARGDRTGELPPNGLAHRIVMETLRLEQSEYLIRRATRPIEVDGFVIPRGWFVRFCIQESHRDAALFEEPDTFNPDRFLAGGHGRSTLAPFGVPGPRTGCLGEHLTMTLGGVFVDEALQEFDWAVIADGASEYGGFHWRPSSRWRLSVTRRA